MKKIILISGSLSPTSRSAILLKKTQELLEKKQCYVTFLDLRAENIPFAVL